MTRRERCVDFFEKLGLAVGPTAAIALLALATGLPVTAIVYGFLGGLIGLCGATSVETRRGALVAGIATLVFLLAVGIAVNWLGDHPILPE